MKGEPKYLNSPETPVFAKGREALRVCFRRGRRSRAAGRVVVVEGYMDVIALAQHGVEYAVATLGTATTPVHAQKLFRLTDTVVFCFDGDEAGRRAAWRAPGKCAAGALRRQAAAIPFPAARRGSGRRDPSPGQGGLRGAGRFRDSAFRVSRRGARHALSARVGGRQGGAAPVPPSRCSRTGRGPDALGAAAKTSGGRCRPAQSELAPPPAQDTRSGCAEVDGSRPTSDCAIASQGADQVRPCWNRKLVRRVEVHATHRSGRRGSRPWQPWLICALQQNTPPDHGGVMRHFATSRHERVLVEALTAAGEGRRLQR